MDRNLGFKDLDVRIWVDFGFQDSGFQDWFEILVSGIWISGLWMKLWFQGAGFQDLG